MDKIEKVKKRSKDVSPIYKLMHYNINIRITFTVIIIEEKIKNDQTTTTTAIINRDIKANSSTSTGGTTEKEEDGNIEFSKEDIEPLTVHNVSLLDKALKGSTSSLGQKPVLLGNEGAVLHLTIYLPTRSEMKIDVSIKHTELFTYSVC
jgi:hypothetical protein